MYTYQIGYHSHEDSDYVEMTHPIAFSEGEFERMFVEATAIVAQAAVPELEAGLDAPPDPFFIENVGEEQAIDYKERERREGVSFALGYTSRHEGVEAIAQVMCDKYGFQPVTFTQRISVFGWCNLLQRGDWGYGNDTDCTTSRLMNHLIANVKTKYPPAPEERD